jgi:UDP:flavonoid glycosyltransferase YjiC (YdhE family)
MQITFLALGSQGDVRPYAHIAMALINAGHQATFITTDNFKSFIEEAGIKFISIPGDAESLVQNNDANARSLMWGFRNIARGMITNSQQIVLALAESDMILNQLPGGVFGLDITEKYGVPMCLAATIPLVRTSAFPMMGWPTAFSRLPGYNQLSYHLSEQMAWMMLKPLVNQWREAVLGLQKISTADYFRNNHPPVLNGFSQYMVPRPADWGDHIHVTGYWFAPVQGWEPPEKLQRFLERQPQPVYIGFGSMPLCNPVQTTRMVIRALEASGQRAVLHSGWGGLGQGDLPENILKVGYVPHSWLFPRVKAVIHHGGASTTAAGLRAGVPSLLIPFLFDQFFWANRIAQSGLGPDPVAYRDLSSARLTAGINRAVNDPGISKKADEIGEKINTENGVHHAIKIISDLLNEKQGATK